MMARPSIVKLPNAKEEGGMQELTRRTLLAGTALAALSAGTAMAAAPPVGRRTPGVYRDRIGSFELTALYDGIYIARSLTSSSAMRRFLK